MSGYHLLEQDVDAAGGVLGARLTASSTYGQPAWFVTKGVARKALRRRMAQLNAIVAGGGFIGEHPATATVKVSVVSAGR